jgi:glycerol-3-phosphate dehydrogenase
MVRTDGRPDISGPVDRRREVSLGGRATVFETTVLVVGGGATGVGVARDLALRGVDVTLVEADRLAGGTTGRSHGLLHSGARYAVDDPDDAADCLAENRILRDVAGACIRDTGGYFLELDGDDPDRFAATRAACADLGMAVETLDGDDLPVPAAGPRVERALSVPDAVVSPSRLVAATAADAREAGATLVSDSPVGDVDVSDGRVDTVVVGGRLDDRVDAEVVVNAAGPWAGACAALAGVEVPMAPTRGVMVAVDDPRDSVSAVLNRCRAPADGDIVVPRPGEAVLGTTSVAVDDPDDFERADWEIERVVEECAAMCPDLADRRVLRTYWGVRPLYDPAGGTEGRAISRGFALFDGADEGAAGLLSVAGGKLTTHRLMAEVTADRVCERLGVDAECRTADRPLPGADDPRKLESLVAEFVGRAPADGR